MAPQTAEPAGSDKNLPPSPIKTLSRRTLPKLGGWVLACSALTAGLALVGCALPEVPAAPEGDLQLQLGQEIYASSCRSCHGADGGGATGPAIGGSIMESVYPDPADQAELIAQGRGGMPAFGGRLNDEELEAVTAYTRRVLP